MAGRQPLLLIDGFSAYKPDLDLLREGIQIADIDVVFLSVNATSVCQSLNQGRFSDVEKPALDVNGFRLLLKNLKLNKVLAIP